MPCLDEEASVGICVARAFAGIADTGLTGEVIVVDNGSTDMSIPVARAAGARVLTESRQGYGNACLVGFAVARGCYLAMGDADSSYDFRELAALVEPLRAGRADHVRGSRFSGKIMPGAMPWSHRYRGNPLLSGMLNRLFGAASSDAHSGMRAFTRAAYERMRPRCAGMEFASELVILAARSGLRVAEVPITDHRRVGVSKLRSLRDGWRHVRFMLPLAPRSLFVIPGLLLLVAGMAGQLVLPLLLPDAGPRRFDVHFWVLSAMVAVLGWQVVLLGVFTDIHNRVSGRAGYSRPPLARGYRYFTLERGLAAGGVLFVVGCAVEAAVLGRWIVTGAGALEQARPGLLAMTVAVLGAGTGFVSFFLHLLTTEGVAAAHGGTGSPRPGEPASGRAPSSRPEDQSPEPGLPSDGAGAPRSGVGTPGDGR
ncbi:glycosyl transferase family 2 [Candidatus Protofrankia datiscae]|uniref:Glycosyl transferase family 2 n=2 Tax=Frankiaceae TaxID=74712 RepID=F8AVF0_9ACTN|nr:glycosyl transferase family 2 [Candidatus Protofrankia datiscae]